MRNGSAANTVPASARCRPSTRMSFSTKGSTAREGGAARQAITTATAATGRSGFTGSRESICRGSSVQAQQAGHVVVERHRHDEQQDRNAAALQSCEPEVRHGTTGDGLEKII